MSEQYILQNEPTQWDQRCKAAGRDGHLVPEDSQALLKGELEPVPAGHPVPSPVVEVLMAHNPLNAGEVHVCGGLRGGQHQAAVEDVEGLVLHGAHVEVIHCHDVEQVQVIFQPKGVLQTNRRLVKA